MATNIVQNRAISERPLYTWVAILIPIFVLIGFSPTYYLSGVFGGSPLSPLTHLHGIIMTLWVILFIVQVRLIAARRVKLHRRLGVFGVFLTLAVIVIGTITAVAAAARGSSPGPPPLVFLVIPLGDIFVFAILAGTSLYYRRRPDIHKRLMLIAAFSIMSAAVARFQIAFFQTPPGFFGVIDLCVIACVVYDTVKNRRLHRAFAFGALFLFASHPLRLMLSGTESWIQFASWLVGK